MSTTVKLIELKYDEGKLRASLVALQKLPAQERAILGQSINRALYGLRTDIVRDLRSRTVLKAGTIRKGISVMTAYWYSHKWARSYVRVSTSRLPLTEYKVTPLRQTAQKGRKPIKYKPLSYRLAPGGKSFGNAPQDEGRSKLFMVRGKKSGKLGVFVRLGQERLPIVRETGPSLQFFYGDQARQVAIMAKADARFRAEFGRRISQLHEGGQ